jgi:hypothetical protein
MPSIVTEFLYNEPSGRPISLVHFGTAVAWLGLFAYARTGGPGPSAWYLVVAVGTAMAGVAESLPTGRRRAAGVLRAMAILLLLGLVAGTVLRPSIVVG